MGWIGSSNLSTSKREFSNVGTEHETRGIVPFGNKHYWIHMDLFLDLHCAVFPTKTPVSGGYSYYRSYSRDSLVVSYLFVFGFPFSLFPDPHV
jgi:hypothetical protein